MSAQTNPVIWFEIPVTDLDRAKAFYGHVFDVPFEEQTMGETQMDFSPCLEMQAELRGHWSRAGAMLPVKAAP